MAEKVGFLDEHIPGNRSCMRLMSFISLLASLGFGFMELNMRAPYPYLTMFFLIAAFAPKAFQKFAERLPNH